MHINIPSETLVLTPARTRLPVTRRSEESHNNSGIRAKEQERAASLLPEISASFIVCGGMVTCACRCCKETSHICPPEQANNAVSKSRDGQASPTHLLLVCSRHASIHPCVSLAGKMKGHVASEPLSFK